MHASRLGVPGSQGVASPGSGYRRMSFGRECCCCGGCGCAGTGGLPPVRLLPGSVCGERPTTEECALPPPGERPSGDSAPAAARLLDGRA
jgi:hypothetical protein